MRSIAVISACICLLGLLAVSHAEEVVLMVRGPGEVAPRTFTEAEIRALPAVTITTLDPWENKERTYTGCTLQRFIEMLGATEETKIVHLIAKDAYSAKITRAELIRYQHLLSYEMDGKDYSLWGDSDKGPLAIAVKMENVTKADKIRVKNQMVLWIQEMVLK